MSSCSESSLSTSRQSRVRPAERTTSPSALASPAERTSWSEERSVAHVSQPQPSSLVLLTLRPSRLCQTYIFEVVEVVPQPGRPHSKHKLKLLVNEPCKGAVTAISDINGYLVSATAQKVSHCDRYLLTRARKQWLTLCLPLAAGPHPRVRARRAPARSRVPGRVHLRHLDQDAQEPDPHRRRREERLVLRVPGPSRVAPEPSSSRTRS